MAFIFYDTETTGLETAFDQILQFAAIKTDDDLNELDRFDFRCRLMPHIVPSPGALRVTDERIWEYARRLIYIEAPEVLSDSARAAMDAWIRDRVLIEDTTVPWNIIPKALRQTGDLLVTTSRNDAVLLTDVRRFLVEIADRCEPS